MEVAGSTNLKKNISLFIFLFVNFVFAYKYLYRSYGNYAVLAGTTILIIQLLIWKNQSLLIKLGNKLNLVDTIIIVGFISASAFAFTQIPATSLNVDRWSVISSFWDKYFQDKYVYFAVSHMGNPPGPMPFYYVLALPFYLIGELGFYSLTGFIVFYALMRNSKTERYKSTLALVLICTSLFYLWEVICRSNIFINGTLVLASVLYFFRPENTNKYRHLIITGVLTGLCMSTRNVFAIPYLIAFLYALKNKDISFKNLVLIGIIAIGVIVLSFIPFVYNHIEDFKRVNPFVIQGTVLMPFAYTLIFIALAFVFPFMCRSKNDVYFYSGLLLFLTIVFYFGYHMFNLGFNGAVHESHADNSYFLFCLPFALFYVLKADAKN